MPSLTLRPRATSAAARRSSIRLLVHEPMNTVSTATLRIGVPAVRPMYSSARAADSCWLGSSNEAGSGMLSSMAMTCPGLVPHET